MKDFKYKDYIEEDKLYNSREDMPQIDLEHISDFLLYMLKKEVVVVGCMLKMTDLKPSQDEFNEAKILQKIKDKSKQYQHRLYLVSKDNDLLDGHHDWSQGLEDDEEAEVAAMKFQVSIKDLIDDAIAYEKSYKVNVEGDIVKSEEDLFEKAKKNLAKLTKKIVTDKNGHNRIVYVRTHTDETTGKEHNHEFESGHSVSFEHNGKSMSGKIASIKHHEKFDPYGTATIHATDGSKVSKSLLRLTHSDEAKEDKKPEEVGEDIVGKTKSGKPIYKAKTFTNKKLIYSEHNESEISVGHRVESAGGNHVVSKINGDKVVIKDNEGAHIVDKSQLKGTGQKVDINEYDDFHKNMYRSKHEVDGLPNSRIEQKKNGKYHAVYNTISQGEFDTPEQAEAKLDNHHDSVKKLQSDFYKEKGKDKEWQSSTWDKQDVSNVSKESQNSENSSTVEEAWDARVATIDTSKEYRDLKDLKVGDVILSKTGSLGFVQKINPKSVDIETTYGRRPNIEMLKLNIKKEYISVFKKPKTEKTIEKSQQADIQTAVAYQPAHNVGKHIELVEVKGKNKTFLRKQIVGSSDDKPKEAKEDVWKEYRQYNLSTYPAKDVVKDTVKVDTSGDIDSHWVLKWEDSNGLTKYGYTPEFYARNAKNKYKRVEKLLSESVGNMKSEAEQVLNSKNGALKDENAAILMIIETGLRGGDAAHFKKSGNRGICTLSKDNVKIKGDTIELDFTGKKGVQNHSLFKNKTLAKYLQEKMKDKSGDDLIFDTNRAKVLKFFKEKLGDEFLLKDLRTYTAGTMALNHLYSKDIQLTGDVKKDKKLIIDMVKETSEVVSNKLCNEPSMSKKSYIHPVIWEHWIINITGEQNSEYLALVKASTVPTIESVWKSARKYWKNQEIDSNQVEDLEDDEEMNEFNLPDYISE